MTEHRSAECLDPALHETDDRSEDIHLQRGFHEKGKYRDADIGPNADPDSAFCAIALSHPAEYQGRRKADELHQKQRRDQVVRGQPDRQAKVDRHAYDGIDTVNVQPVGKQEHPRSTVLRKAGGSITQSCERAFDVDSTPTTLGQRLFYIKKKRYRKHGPPNCHRNERPAHTRGCISEPKQFGF